PTILVGLAAETQRQQGFRGNPDAALRGPIQCLSTTPLARKSNTLTTARQHLLREGCWMKSSPFGSSLPVRDATPSQTSIRNPRSHTTHRIALLPRANHSIQLRRQLQIRPS